MNQSNSFNSDGYNHKFKQEIALPWEIIEPRRIFRAYLSDDEKVFINAYIDTNWRIIIEFVDNEAIKVYTSQRMQLEENKAHNIGFAFINLSIDISGLGDKVIIHQLAGDKMRRIYPQDKKDRVYNLLITKRISRTTGYHFVMWALLPQSGEIISELELFKSKYDEKGNRSLEVIMDKEWRIICNLYDGKINTKHVFQRMELQENYSNEIGDALAVFEIDLYGSHITLWCQVGIRRYKIEEYDLNKKVYTIPILIYKSPKQKTFPTLDPSTIKSSADRIFLFKVQELDDKIHTEGSKYLDEYSLIAASALLRQFLLDDGGVVPGIAKRLGCQLEFFITFKARIKNTSLQTFFSLDPSSFQSVQYTSVGLKEFFNTPVINNYGQLITVLETIKAVANGKGGVHSKLKKNNTTQKELLDLDDMISLLGQEISLNFVQEIGQVVLTALKPIVDKIISNNA